VMAEAMDVEFDVPSGIFGRMMRNVRRHKERTRAILVEGTGAAGRNTKVDRQKADPR
jgi:hypothetical protein